VFFIAAIILAEPGVLAETRYVTDEFKINVRSGPNVEYRILSMIPSKEKVELLETQENWSRIQLSDGTEGWVLSQYLVDRTPASILLETYKRENHSLKDTLGSIREENRLLKEKSSNLEKELQENKTALAKTQEDYNNLKSDSAEYLKLKAEYQQLKEQYEKKEQELNTMTAEHEKLLFSNKIKWFLSGTAVFIVGWLIGFIMRSKSRRRSFYLT